MPSAFFDTNIFLYADDESDALKQKLASDLIIRYQADNSGLLSTQVLQEYFAASTKKLGLSSQAALAKVELMTQLRVVKLNELDIISAINLHLRHKISIWDATIVFAAGKGGAEILFSEDLHHGGMLAGVRVVNPFRDTL